jgi:2Fe-2S ferredoxin
MDKNDVSITIIDREGNENILEVPTDMAMNIMEVCKSAELGVEEWLFVLLVRFM